MAVVYQLGKSLTATKDMIFGWTLMGPEGTLILNSVSAETLSAVRQVLPGGPLYKELREFVDTRLQTLKGETGKPVGKVISQPPTEEETTVQKERRAVQTRMEESMRIWFGNLTPARVYEFKNPSDGYTYAWAVPHSAGYVVIDDRLTVVGEFKDVSEVAGFVLRRWW